MARAIKTLKLFSMSRSTWRTSAPDFFQPQAHVVDGRQAHSVLMEVFTERGVGTMVLPDDEPVPSPFTGQMPLVSDAARDAAGQIPGGTR